MYHRGLRISRLLQKDAEDGRRAARDIPGYTKSSKEISGQVQLAFYPVGRCRQENRRNLRRDERKEHVRQEGVGRGSHHVRYRPGRQNPTYLREGQARGARRRGSRLLERRVEGGRIVNRTRRYMDLG